jgi:hypothetical protein
VVVLAYVEKHCSVQDPQGALGRSPTVPFTAKSGQREFALTMRAMGLAPSWAIACKSRQVGLTTLLLCWIAALCLLRPGITCAFVAPDKTLFGPIAAKWSTIWQSVAESRGADFPGVAADNDREFKFSNGSRVIWAPAGETRRNATKAIIGETVNFCVLSELAVYPFGKVTIAALRPTLNLSGACIVVDSTPPQEPGTGEAYTEIAKATLDGEPDHEFFFWPWWMEPSYRLPVPLPIAQYTEEERTLAAKHLLDPFQMAWRRKTKASKAEGPTFAQTYPETPAAALNPKRTGYAFADEIIELGFRKEQQDYDPPLDQAALWQIFPPALRREFPAGDMFFSARWCEPVEDGYVRVWRPPVPGVRYKAGLDPSDGLRHGDWQTCGIVDQWNEVCAYIRTRIEVPRFAALAQRLCTWFGAELELEMSAHGGPATALWLRSAVEPDRVAAMRAWGLEKPFRFRERSVSTEHRSTRIGAYIQWVNGGNTIRDAETFAEVTTIDPDTGRCRKNKGEHDDILDFVGIAVDLWDRERANTASASTVGVHVAPRVQKTNSLGRK